MQTGIRNARAAVRLWFSLSRPWSLTATFVPLACAAALARNEPSFAWWRWTLALVAAAALHLVVNLLNVWGDDRSGVDRAPGAICTTPQIQSGIVTPRQVLAAAAVCFAVSAAFAAPLFFAPAFNLPLAIVAAIGAGGALNYSTGAKFKYRALGVPFVFFLMGTLEVVGGIFAAAPGADVGFVRVLLLSLPINALVAAIMHANDMRDVAGDRAAGIRTAANVLGPRISLALYCVLHLTPYVISLFCFLQLFHSSTFPLFHFSTLPLFHSNTPTLEHFLLLPFAALPLTIRALRSSVGAYRVNPNMPSWISLEGDSAKLHFLVGSLWCAALFLVLR